MSSSMIPNIDTTSVVPGWFKAFLIHDMADTAVILPRESGHDQLKIIIEKLFTAVDLSVVMYYNQVRGYFIASSQAALKNLERNPAYLSYLQVNKQVEVKVPAPEVHIPRPRNSWILYRLDKSKEIRATNPGITASNISTTVAYLWREEDEEVKNHYRLLAEREASMHREMYPHYKYDAGKSKKRKAIDDADDDSRSVTTVHNARNSIVPIRLS